eukprot:1533039-Amphidinium_carterae.1
MCCQVYRWSESGGGYGGRLRTNAGGIAKYTSHTAAMAILPVAFQGALQCHRFPNSMLAASAEQRARPFSACGHVVPVWRHVCTPGVNFIVKQPHGGTNQTLCAKHRVA